MSSSTEINLQTSDVSDAHTFYNNPQEHGLNQRNESKIVHMRNFNNWIKSTLISRPYHFEFIQLFDYELFYRSIFATNSK